jgi:hypothetical protein
LDRYQANLHRDPRSICRLTLRTLEVQTTISGPRRPLNACATTQFQLCVGFPTASPSNVGSLQAEATSLHFLRPHLSSSLPLPARKPSRAYLVADRTRGRFVRVDRAMMALSRFFTRGPLGSVSLDFAAGCGYQPVCRRSLRRTLPWILAGTAAVDSAADESLRAESASSTREDTELRHRTNSL